MLTEFDQTTIANMTAALEYVCKKLPADKDTHELRKLLGDAIIQSASSGRLSYVELQNAGLKALEDILRPPKSNWLRGLCNWPVFK